MRTIGERNPCGFYGPGAGVARKRVDFLQAARAAMRYAVRRQDDDGTDTRAQGAEAPDRRLPALCAVIEHQAQAIDILQEEVKNLKEEVAALQEKGPRPLWRPRDVARYLNVSERTVEMLIASKAIIPLWVGGSRRFDPDAIEAYVRKTAGGRKAA